MPTLDYTLKADADPRDVLTRLEQAHPEQDLNLSTSSGILRIDFELARQENAAHQLVMNTVGDLIERPL